jgi:hypothetical protein
MRVNVNRPNGAMVRRSIRRALLCAAIQSAMIAPGKLRPPSERGGAAAEPGFDCRERPAFRADVIDENDLAAGFDDPHQLIERGGGIGHDGQHIRRNRRVEAGIRESEAHRVHDREAVHIAILSLRIRVAARRSIGSERSTPTSRVALSNIGNSRPVPTPTSRTVPGREAAAAAARRPCRMTSSKVKS